MKDFADLDNSSGAFPDVIGVDASGPGETDGTELTADLFNDLMGAFQAILNDQSGTPSGSAESGSGTSQILNALKLLHTPKIYHPALWVSAWDGSNPDWEFDEATNYMESLVDDGEMVLPLNLPIGTLNTEFIIRVSAGDIRTGNDRIGVGLWKQTRTGSLSLVGSVVYDAGTAGLQDITVTNNSVAVAEDEIYWLRLQAGDDASTNPDDVRPTTADISFS